METWEQEFGRTRMHWREKVAEALPGRNSSELINSLDSLESYVLEGIEETVRQLDRAGRLRPELSFETFLANIFVSNKDRLLAQYRVGLAEHPVRACMCGVEALAILRHLAEIDRERFGIECATQSVALANSLVKLGAHWVAQRIIRKGVCFGSSDGDGFNIEERVVRIDSLRTLARICLAEGRFEEGMALLSEAAGILVDPNVSRYVEASTDPLLARSSVLTVELNLCLSIWQLHTALGDAFAENKKGIGQMQHEKAAEAMTAALNAIPERCLAEADYLRVEFLSKRSTSLVFLQARWEEAHGDALEALRLIDEIEKVLIETRSGLFVPISEGSEITEDILKDLLATDASLLKVDSYLTRLQSTRVSCLSTLNAIGSNHPHARSEHIVEEARRVADHDPSAKLMLAVQLANWARNLADEPGDALYAIRNNVLDELIEVSRQLKEDMGASSPQKVRHLAAYALRDRGVNHFYDRKYEEAIALLLEAANILDHAEGFLNPLLGSESTQEFETIDYLVAAIMKSGLREPSLSLDVTERHKARSLHRYATLKSSAAHSGNAVLQNYASHLGEYFRATASELEGSMTGQVTAYAELRHMRECLTIRQEQAAELEAFDMPALSTKQIASLAGRMGRTIIDLRLTRTGTAVHVTIPSGEISHLFVETANAESLLSDENIRAWLSLRFPGSDTDTNNAVVRKKWERATFDALETLRSKLMSHIQPIVEQLPRGSYVAWIPDKFLSLLPLHGCAWDGNNDGVEFWGDRFVMTYAPSASMLDVAHRNYLHNGFGSKVQVVANTSMSNSLRPLPFAAFEAAALALLYRTDCDLFCGIKARRQATLERLHGVNTVHMALHATVDLRNPAFSSLVFEGDPIKASRIATSSMFGVEHAILSACDTGQFDLSSSNNDFFALAGSFMTAGIPSVWATLWRVDDAATALIMAKAHEHKKAGLAARDALRDSQKWFRELAGEQALDFALPILEAVKRDHEAYGLDEDGVADLEYHVSRLAEHEDRFKSPVYWAAVQHVGI